MTAGGPGAPPGALTIGIDGRELQGRPTGTGRYLRNLLRTWPTTTQDRLVVYFNGPAPSDDILDRPGIVRRPLGEAPARGLLWQERHLPAAARADVLDVFFAPAYACPLSLRVPRVTTVHDLSFFSYPQDFTAVDALRRRLLVSASVRASRLILAVSDFMRREILARFPGAEGRVLHVPHGADDDVPPLPPREQARQRLEVRGPFLISVGSILNRRRLPELLRAVAGLAPRWPGLRLDVVGENRTHPRLDVHGLVARLGLERCVRLRGFIDDRRLADCYAAADVAIYLSEYEGFGLPALEAMARGVPVVIGDRPALTEIFGAAALGVDPGDVTAIGRALDRLLREPGLKADLAARGRAIAAHYTWVQAAASTREALAAAARS